MIIIILLPLSAFSVDFAKMPNNYYYFLSLEIIQIPSFPCLFPREMPRQHRRPFARLASADEQAAACEGEGRLDSIIKTFRENNLRLMQKIEQCDRVRQFQYHLNQKKLSQRHLLEPFDLAHHHTFARPLSQFKTERRRDPFPKHASRKENLALEMTKLGALSRGENCESVECNIAGEKNLKLVKISLNKLVPLSMDKLRQRMKML